MFDNKSDDIIKNDKVEGSYHHQRDCTTLPRTAGELIKPLLADTSLVRSRSFGSAAEMQSPQDQVQLSPKENDAPPSHLQTTSFSPLVGQYFSSVPSAQQSPYASWTASPRASSAWAYPSSWMSPSSGLPSTTALALSLVAVCVLGAGAAVLGLHLAVLLGSVRGEHAMLMGRLMWLEDRVLPAGGSGDRIVQEGTLQDRVAHLEAVLQHKGVKSVSFSSEFHSNTRSGKRLPMIRRAADFGLNESAMLSISENDSSLRQQVKQCVQQRIPDIWTVRMDESACHLSLVTSKSAVGKMNVTLNVCENALLWHQLQRVSVFMTAEFLNAHPNPSELLNRKMYGRLCKSDGSKCLDSLKAAVPIEPPIETGQFQNCAVLWESSESNLVNLVNETRHLDALIFANSASFQDRSAGADSPADKKLKSRLHKFEVVNEGPFLGATSGRRRGVLPVTVPLVGTVKDASMLTTNVHHLLPANGPLVVRHQSKDIMNASEAHVHILIGPHPFAHITESQLGIALTFAASVCTHVVVHSPLVHLVREYIAEDSLSKLGINTKTDANEDSSSSSSSSTGSNRPSKSKSASGRQDSIVDRMHTVLFLQLAECIGAIRLKYPEAESIEGSDEVVGNVDDLREEIVESVRWPTHPSSDCHVELKSAFTNRTEEMRYIFRERSRQPSVMCIKPVG